MKASVIKLLNLLADGEFHSGVSVGEILGVSRTAVWKHLQKLSQMGLVFESVTGKGYRLSGGIELLSVEAISNFMSQSVADTLLKTELFVEVDSTNAIAISHLQNSGDNPCLYLAEYQSAGRGRRGRQWFSPFGHNVYLSLTWGFTGGAVQLEGLSLAVGASIATTLERLGGKHVALKWPNDILCEGRKLGGILLEMIGDPAGECQVVVGLGLNVRIDKQAPIDQPWYCLSQQLPDLSRNRLVAELLNDLIPSLQQFEQQGFVSFREDWQGFDAYQGCDVTVVSGNSVIEGVAQGVFADGALCLEVDGQQQAIYGGEVSLRLRDAT